MHSHISRGSISQTSLCFLHILNYVCHCRISQAVLLFLLKYMHTRASVAIPNTMHGSQVHSKWPVNQNGKFSTKEVWIPKRIHRPASELLLSLFIQQWVKQAAPEEKCAKTPRPTLSKVGCMESERFWQLDTTVKWHPICPKNVIVLHGTCLGKEKNPPNTKGQEFSTDLKSHVKQRPLCARAFCSKSTLEKFGIIFSVVFYIRTWKKKKHFPHFSHTTKVRVSFVITLKVQKL